MLRGGVERARVVLGDEDRKGPLEAFAGVLRGVAVPIDARHRDVPFLTPLAVVARERAHVAAAVGDVRISRIGREIRVLAPRDTEILADADPAVV